jgi:hypothetical protein
MYLGRFGSLEQAISIVEERAALANRSEIHIQCSGTGKPPDKHRRWPVRKPKE